VKTRIYEICHFRAALVVNMALSLQYWRSYVEGFVKISRKSEAMVEANRVLTFTFDVEMMVVQATVQASMRDRSYEVGLRVCTERVSDVVR
jgi:hypothetical protein